MFNVDSVYTLYGGGNSTWLIVCVGLALAGTVAAAIYLFGPQTSAHLTGWMRKLAAHVNFEHYIIPLILKFLYMFSALFLFCYGVVTIFTTSVVSGLLMMVLGPLAVRIGYELVMIVASIHDGIRETNRLLRSGAQPRGGAPSQFGRPAYHPQPENQGEQPRRYPGGYDPMHRG